MSEFAIGFAVLSFFSWWFIKRLLKSPIFWSIVALIAGIGFGIFTLRHRESKLAFMLHKQLGYPKPKVKSAVTYISQEFPGALMKDKVKSAIEYLEREG